MIDIHPTDTAPAGTAPHAGLHPTRNGVSADVRAALIPLLNQLLADTVDLRSQIKQAHWNVRGIHFQPLHELFDGVAEVLPGFSDELAERVGMLGGAAAGTVRDSATASRLAEIPGGLLTGNDAVTAVAERIAFVTNAVREGISIAGEQGDEVTADLFTEIARELDKQLWFVESHREG
ncbi:MAG: DNA starvation/stationary phase protection protein Dps [Gemmatimonadetes bacterium]|nr:DNA starvation/stationary phase protection protein Dps [Gemmatimonadota bacterium]NNF38425.1 DNA starvation/stationary phase protection protein Dps [Gemmatimonadota bacterium]NNK64624.1 DNA starvation/stationary phase protection protein Dps [Gemmatimonadota bacterium]